MDFIRWHYTDGLLFYIRRWIYSVKYIEHYFSLPLLISTLFSPWKRLVAYDNKPGFSISRAFENFTFDLISRGIGAVVRGLLFVAGSVVLVFVFLGGGLGVLIWLLLPPIGLSAYTRYKNKPILFIQNINQKLKSGTKLFEAVFESDAGKFFLNHLNISQNEFEQITVFKDGLSGGLSRIKNFEELIQKLVDEETWNEDALRSLHLTPDDLLQTARWWDGIKKDLSDMGETEKFGRPGIGLDLLFGYIPILSQYSIDLSEAKSFAHRLIGRDEVVERMERVISGGSSIILLGQPGVGKKTVVLEFAQKSMTGELGVKASFKRVLEFDYNFLLSGSSDLNSKKTNLAYVFHETAAAGNIILMIRDIQRLTNPEVEGYDFTDVFEEYLEKKNLKIIVPTTPVEYERFIAPNMRLRKYFENIEVTPPSKELALEIMIEVAKNWEHTSKVTVSLPAIRKILDESDRYITETPFPEKAIELMDAVVNYRDQKGGGTVTYEDAEAVLTEKTGVKFSALTSEDKSRLSNLEETIHERLINQNAAVSLISKSLRARNVGGAKESKPIGSFLFLGPTGVGKTETAKVLSNVYFGSTDAILRFDMAEFAGSEGFERLIGSVNKNIPGRLATLIKNKPASLLLLDEFEKATSNIINLFLSILDEGFFTDAFGNRINCRHLFIIATSNAGAEFIRDLVNKEPGITDLQDKVVNKILQDKIFSPELLNRFDGVVVYEPLSFDNLVKVAKLILTDFGANLLKRNVHLLVNDEVCQALVKIGFDPTFGARSIRRLVDLEIGDVVGKAIIENKIRPGDKFEIVPSADGKGFDYKLISQNGRKQ
ncbi:MAG TPA: AAA family ATPase [Patescibacteria group bacterium]|nr:AAA family ATPase [Patescibacteria group bacterium]